MKARWHDEHGRACSAAANRIPRPRMTMAVPDAYAPAEGEPRGAFAHLKVVDLSRILAGPWASQTLADLGADVVKVERKGEGDDTRGWGPPFVTGGSGNESAYFLAANRNKRSIEIDFGTQSGLEIVRRLVAKADIVVENFKVGGLTKFGLDYDSLRQINPGLIYCSITGFGQTGPYAGKPGYDALIQAMGGLMSITGAKDSDGGGPQKIGVALVDILSGLYATIGILAALASRDRTGRGQHIDVALLDVEVACLANQAMNYLVSGQAPGRMGNAHPNIVPYQDFRTSDGAMIIAVGNDAQFRRMCDAIGRADLGADARFATNAGRLAHRDELITELSATLSSRPTSEWVEAIDAAGVPCGPINDIAEVFDDPQIIARGLRLELPHDAVGQVPSVANPLKLSETPVSYRRGPPALGQHGAEILREWLQMDIEQARVLEREGVI